jgi:hypothetical protein
MLIIILVASEVMPDLYWKIFEKNLNAPTIYYSPVTNDFVFMKFDGKMPIFSDNTGRTFSREEFEELTPFLSYRQLVLDDKMPDTINGTYITVPEVKLNNLIFRIKPSSIEAPQIELYPLFESRSGKVNLEMPQEFFRINKRLEFINCEENTINEALSIEYTEALRKEGFDFPSRMIAGNPTTRKLFDEGYFIIDNADKVFHLKRIHGKPFCQKLDIPGKPKVVHVLISENKLMEFYGMLITEDNNVYLISYDNYRLIKLPLDDYDYKSTTLRMIGNLLFREFTLHNESGIKVIVTDRDYKVVDTYEESIITKYETTAGKFFYYVFPFSLSLSSQYSAYINFYFRSYFPYALAGNVISLFLALIFFHTKKIKMTRYPAELLIIAITGIYGLIAVLITRERNS